MRTNSVSKAFSFARGWIGKGAWRVRERSFEWRRGCGRVERGTWPAGVERCGDAGSVLV